MPKATWAPATAAGKWRGLKILAVGGIKRWTWSGDENYRYRCTKNKTKKKNAGRSSKTYKTKKPKKHLLQQKLTKNQ